MEKNKSRFVLRTVFIFSALCLFAVQAFAGDFSDYEKKLLSEIYDMRARSRQEKDYLASQAFLEEYHKKIWSDDVQSKIGDEARLTFDNLLTLERWQYLWETDPDMDGLKPMITEQYEKIIAWNESHPFDEQNPYLKLSAFDLINSTMQYMKRGQMIKLGLQEKKVYDKLLETDPDNCIVYLNAGQFYYNVSEVLSGAKPKAKRIYEKAVKIASNNYEKYFANIFIAQMFLEEENMDEYNQHIAAAEQAIPNTPYMNFVKAVNEKGYTLYEYALHPAKIKKRVFVDKKAKVKIK
jgi:tetratricopeptide (TPR) repeat protein